MRQCASKQALSIIKSQSKKLKKSKPEFNKLCMELDSRFVDVDINPSTNRFDIWIKLLSIGDKIKLFLPGNKHIHFNKFDINCVKKSLRIRKTEKGFFADFYFEIKKPDLKTEGDEIGMDCGYKKLLIDSNNKKYDENLENIYNKISRKKQGSKSFKRALIERDEAINRSIKEIDLDPIKTIYVENLKNVKYKSKFNKKVNNKLQRWSYSKVLCKLEMMCEEHGVRVQRVDPDYTSQTCSHCGSMNKNSRNGEYFKCKECGFKIDSDYNAAINILKRGLSENMVPILTETNFL
jgi:IS605 OrfB family transposase